MSINLKEIRTQTSTNTPSTLAAEVLSMLMPEHGVFSAYLALTFKHAVEFSSFGCTPRICLIDSRLGLTRLTLFGLTLGVKSEFLTFSATFDRFRFHDFGIICDRSYFISSAPGVKSEFGSEWLSRASSLLKIPHPGQPDQLYQVLARCQTLRSRSWPVHI